MADLGRRAFLGTAGLLAGAAACRKPGDPYTPNKPPVPVQRGTRAGEERWVLTACGLCRAACGLRVRVVDGRAVKVEGNPDSVVHRGGVCARGQASLQLLYHPDRIRGPRRRIGQRGDNRWQDVSWEDAIALLAAELGKLRMEREPQSLVLLDGQYTGITHALWSRFMAAFGSPNHVGHGCGGRGQMLSAVRNLVGVDGVLGYDFDRTACVLLVGTGAVESSPHAIALAKALGRAQRPRVLCASPRLPRLASFVDDWLDVVPGSSTTLLLGIAHVLLRDKLGDEALLARAAGFSSWTDDTGEEHLGLRRRLLTELTPERVSTTTGVSAERIEATAKVLAAQRPSLVAVDEELADRGVAHAAILLNALLGNIDAPGGLRICRDGALTFEPPVADSVALAGLAAPSLDGRASSGGARLLSLPNAILSGKPYGAKVLLQSYSNPVYSKPGGKLWRDAIAKVPFVVSFSPFADESTALADLVLPESTFFERWEIEATDLEYAIRQPVVRPLFNSMHAGDVILRVAHLLDEGVRRALPWKDVGEATLAGLAAALRTQPSLVEDLQSAGVLERDDSEVKRALLDVRSIAWSAPAVPSDAVRFPFVLVPFRGPGYAEGGLGQMAWLAELPAVANPWGQKIEVSADDAHRLGIEHGDALWVESAFGALTAEAQVSNTVRPGVLGLALGRVEAMSLLGSFADESSGHWLCGATRAQIRKLG